MLGADDRGLEVAQQLTREAALAFAAPPAKVSTAGAEAEALAAALALVSA